MRLDNQPDTAVTLQPVTRDLYQAGRMTVRFLRNAAGPVLGFRSSTPVVRHLQFRRSNRPDG
ncbi:hypothetical protein [Deinococcus sonorensis]|uniref:Uncharacterized protein n=2 Tax=Deinococcus sonorensis TaxID=309891 RepID=A0AAU7U6G1_9DEIO